MCLLAEWSPIAMQLRAFIACAFLLSGLASAANLPRANEAAQCSTKGHYCSRIFGPHCCTGTCSGLSNGVSVAIHTVFLLLLTQLWSIVLPSVIRWLLALARKLSLMNQGQIKFSPLIACSDFCVQILAFICVCLMNHYE